MHTRMSDTFNVPQVTRLQAELATSKEESAQIAQQIKQLQARKRKLDSRVLSIKEELKFLNENPSAVSHFDRNDFSWSAEMNQKLKSVFHINEFRSHQKSAINATMSGTDCILIMPTGGGKSLCFQLPAILSPGVTLVVSPLISLMEDQLQALQQLNIPTALFNANTTKPQTKYIFDSMVQPSADLKLLYVTPEKLAKSKRLMSQLEKMYKAGRFARLVIDEVHCCSQWGHDFRPDYKFLGIMKRQYPTTPIIGLTATATNPVTLDVQKMLNIEGCLVFKDSFFRPNLKYEVYDCPEKDRVEEISELIKSRFKGKSGIIYCLTIKDVEDVAKQLRGFGIRARGYHAQLEAEVRSAIQTSWYNNDIQVIVATVAFGMGINKLDVRFVVHHSMSKSVENFYQESGRAGRDGDEAWCILYYRFLDVFRATSLMMTEKNGTRNVYNMLRYCLDRQSCRKALIAQHFGDVWDTDSCKGMCDNCEMKLKAREGQSQVEVINCLGYLKDILKILHHGDNLEQRITALKLMDSWFSKGDKKLRVSDVPVPKKSRAVCEAVVAHLILDAYISEEFHFTPYATISHLVPGSKFPGDVDCINYTVSKRILVASKQLLNSLNPTGTSTSAHSRPKKTSTSCTGEDKASSRKTATRIGKDHQSTESSKSVKTSTIERSSNISDDGDWVPEKKFRFEKNASTTTVNGEPAVKKMKSEVIYLDSDSD